MQKRVLLAVLMMTAAAVSVAQSFLGIDYGTLYQKALTALETRYHENVQPSGDKVIIVNPTVGGCVFDCAIASFNVRDGESVLDGGVMFLESPVSETDKQVKRQQDLIARLSVKYGDDVALEKDDDGFDVFSFGSTLTPTGKWLGGLYIVRRDGVCALVLNYRSIIQTDDNL